jgi:hypothetical protein
MIYGIAGTSLMVFAGLLSARKQVSTWRIGRAQLWLKGHIWLGLLSAPFLLFHSGFHWGGHLERVLWWVYGAIIVSGLFGLALQQFLPRLMIRLIPMETIYEQIPHVCAAILHGADESITAVCGPLGIEHAASATGEHGKKKGKPIEPAEGSGPLLKFYLAEVRPFLAAADPGAMPLANTSRRAAVFEQVRIMLPEALHGAVDQLAVFCEERRQLALQARMHVWLHSWLFIHIPLSVALLVLTGAHIVSALWY